MLHAMRKGAGGWLAKGLLVLLVASFAVWGIGGDMLTSSRGSNVIEVGDVSVSFGEFQRDYQRNLNILSQRFQTRLTAEQARQFGLAQMTVNQIASRALVEEKTKQLGLNADDAAIRRMIQLQPIFQNEFNQFDRFRFQSFLQQNGYSEGEYVEIVRNDITGQQLINSLTMPITKSPKVLLDVMYAYQEEKRSASFVEILDSNIGFAPAPTDEELTEYVSANPERFSAPEYRKISYLYLKPEDFVEETAVSDKDLQNEYEGRLSEFNVPEVRSVQQMIFDSEESAQAALNQIEGGSSFEEVGLSELQLTPEDLDLGLMSEQDLLPELQGPVYNLLQDGVSKPVKTVLGWHLVKVTEIQPETSKTLDEVKDQLTQDIRLREAYDVMFRQATKIEDEFAGGATVADAGKAVGIPVVTVDAVDSQGNDASGQPITSLPADPAFLADAFTRPSDSDAELRETQSGAYFAIAIDGITEAAVRPLADVREQATTDWQTNWRQEEARKQADALLLKTTEGESLEKIAESTGSTIQTSPAVQRTGSPGDLSPELRDGLFGLQKGAFGVGPNAAGNGFVLYTIADIIPAETSADPEAAEQMSAQLANGIRASILSQYESYLQKQIGISVKEDLIREYF
ncbi:MAG: SurA N-terminal domain-containing protein [Proteobacteria bacterium]|nr:SurA N-terminal domain-containing protein [Pseudomonadota bacterium]